MPREAREKSESGIYHIMLRGNGKKEIFHNDEDCKKFLNILKKIKNKVGFKLYGWCLMRNHVHLLIEEGNENISNTMKRIGVSYVLFYNKKYERVGHLFQDRFKSERIETDKYLLTAIRYIHQNPVKAKLEKNAHEWKWSSCVGYYKKENPYVELLDRDLILNMFSDDKMEAIKNFKEYNETVNTDKCLDYKEITKLSDIEAKEKVNKLLEEFNIEISDIKDMPRIRRNGFLIKANKIEGITHRQLAKIMEISPNIIFKISKSKWDS